MANRQIDPSKVRAALRRLGDDSVFYLLNEAIDLLPQAKLLKLVKRYLDPSELEPDGEDRGNLLSDVKAFEKASLSGEYYESFNVNSKNCTVKSTGTRAWIATCHRLLDCCTTQARKGDSADVRQAFEIIFGLLDHIDECLDDVIFFADEAGSWQVGVDWNKVLPSWFRVLSATAGPEEYAERITVLLEHHCNSGSEKMLSIARRKGTPQQRKAVSDIVDRNAGQRPRGRKP
jgi:hypothetical protein